MQRSSRIVAALALAVLACAVQLVLTPGPGSAAVFAPLTRIHEEQVNGDFTISGNAVLVCPTAPGTPRTECLGASRRENPFNNNRFAMTYADVDADPATYNSSTASVTIPVGAHATYARLQWGGNRDGQQCGVGAPGAYPPGSAATQQVRLTVGDAATRAVSPGDYTTDTTSIGYYSADADVTDAFASLPDGQPVTVTVGNVFAPTGVGCWGGWSVTVIYDTPDAGCAVQRREVFVFDGHVRQGVTDPPLDATAVGLRVAGTSAHFGVTAFEGDSGQTGDQLLLNGTNIPEFNTGALANFFNSTADHQIAPDYPNNFSVDATSLTAPPGVINLGVAAGGDERGRVPADGAGALGSDPVTVPREVGQPRDRPSRRPVDLDDPGVQPEHCQRLRRVRRGHRDTDVRPRCRRPRGGAVSRLHVYVRRSGERSDEHRDGHRCGWRWWRAHGHRERDRRRPRPRDRDHQDGLGRRRRGR